MKRELNISRLEEILGDIFNDSSDVYILFVDLCGSTAFKQNNIEFVWVQRQLIFLQRVAEFVRKRDGIVVKTIGDELMAIFQASIVPEDILKCAIEIVQYFKDSRLFRGNQKIEAKVSIDFGQTYNGSIVNTLVYDPIGTPVDRCARLNSITKNNEITFSEDFKSTLLTNSSEAQLQEKYGYEIRLEDLKGIQKTTVYCIKIE
ncbi:MAG: adenylate cyclase [Anaerolineaceae bacterium]|nr:MAG: adenylate cyclase [Anaerolineaceae bacterium]